MMHMILAGLAMVFLLNGFHYLYCFSGVNRAYLGLYKSLVEEATVVSGTTGGYLSAPLIHIPRLESLLDRYFTVELKPYCRRYRFEVTAPDYTYVPVTASRVAIVIDVTIDDLHQLRKEARFKIQEASLL